MMGGWLINHTLFVFFFFSFLFLSPPFQEETKEKCPVWLWERRRFGSACMLFFFRKRGMNE